MAEFMFVVRSGGIKAIGHADGTVDIIWHGPPIILPAELVRQLRGELENQALDRVAAYARERAKDMLVARDRARRPDNYRVMERTATAYREMAAKAIAEKES